MLQITHHHRDRNHECWTLRYGDNRAAVVRVVPDFRWPNMWRIAWPDGRLSDLANLTRAKDAAEAVCERGPPRRNARLFRWKFDRRERPGNGVYVRLNGGGLA